MLSSACSQPDYEDVKRTFNAENPGCSAISAEPGEGDSDNVYVYVKYTCSKFSGEVEWLYQREGKEWRRARELTTVRTKRVTPSAR